MQECPSCGIRNEDNRRQCFRCGGEMPVVPGAASPAQSGQVFAQTGATQYSPPPGYGQPDAGQYYTPPPGTPSAFRRVDGVDEEYLSQFSWGPGCGFYLLSRAMLYFWLGSAVLNLIGKLLESSAETADENNLNMMLSLGFMGLLLVIASFGLMIYAGKVARRRRWEMLRWRDFEHFRSDEGQWHTVGIIGWVVNLLILIGSFFAGFAEAGGP